MANKFKVGDIVRGNRDNLYPFTSIKMTKGEVKAVNENGFLTIKVLEHESPIEVGTQYNHLKPEWFDFVSLADGLTKTATLDNTNYEMHPYSDKHHDNVNHPSHYTSHPSGIECIEITRHYCFAVGNAIKYLWRAGLKKEMGMEDTQKEIEDLKKAIFYINDRIKELEKGK